MSDEQKQREAEMRVLIIIGDTLASRLQWIAEEPNSGLVPEVLDAIRESSKRDIDWWENAVARFGFPRKQPRSQGAMAE